MHAHYPDERDREASFPEAFPEDGTWAGQATGYVPPATAGAGAGATPGWPFASAGPAVVPGAPGTQSAPSAGIPGVGVGAAGAGLSGVAGPAVPSWAQGHVTPTGVDPGVVLSWAEVPAVPAEAPTFGQTAAVPTSADLFDVTGLLNACVAAGGSDLILTVGIPPNARIDGELHPLRPEPVTVDEVDKAVSLLVADDRRDILERELAVDFSFSWHDEARFRGNVFRARHNYSVALRHLPGIIPTPEELAMPAAMQALAQKQQGLVLVTGPTGSGKSTTIASLVDRVNRTRPCHILTLEDPIEYVLTPARAVVNQREIGYDTPDFTTGLRSILREDPDVVVVGEMRDLESIGSALTIAETGHLVFATLHTNDAPQAVDRIIDIFPGAQQQQIRTQLSAALLAVVHQRLHPRPGGGRLAAFELLLANEAVRNLIREAKTNQLRNVMTAASAEGMITLEAYEQFLANHGLIAV